MKERKKCQRTLCECATDIKPEHIDSSKENLTLSLFPFRVSFRSYLKKPFSFSMFIIQV